jgi:hypothetical protein
MYEYISDECRNNSGVNLQQEQQYFILSEKQEDADTATLKTKMFHAYLNHKNLLQTEL